MTCTLLYNCAGVHFDPGVQHARPYTHAGLCLSTLRQAILTSVAAAGSRQNPHRRASVPLPAVLQDVRRQVQPSSTRPDALGTQAVLVCAVWQGVRSQELPLQARGVVVYARWTGSGHRVPAETAAADVRHQHTDLSLHWSSVSHVVAIDRSAL